MKTLRIEYWISYLFCIQFLPEFILTVFLAYLAYFYIPLFVAFVYCLLIWGVFPYSYWHHKYQFISVHRPFLFPNKQSYHEIIQNQIYLCIPKQKLPLDIIQIISSFLDAKYISLLDENLKDYFTYKQFYIDPAVVHATPQKEFEFNITKTPNNIVFVTVPCIYKSSCDYSCYGVFNNVKEKLIVSNNISMMCNVYNHMRNLPCQNYENYLLEDTNKTRIEEKMDKLIKEKKLSTNEKFVLVIAFKLCPYANWNINNSNFPKRFALIYDHIVTFNP